MPNFSNPFIVVAGVLSALCLLNALRLWRLRRSMQGQKSFIDALLPSTEFLLFGGVGLALVLVGVPLASSSVVVYQVFGAMLATLGFQVLAYRLGIESPLLGTNLRRGGGGGSLMDVSQVEMFP